MDRRNISIGCLSISIIRCSQYRNFRKKRGCQTYSAGVLQPTQYTGRDPDGICLSKSDIDFSEAKRLAAKADLVVFCAGLDGSIELEGRDRPFDLPYGQDMLIQELVKVNPKLIVAIHAGGGINMTRWIDQVPAVVHALYPGRGEGRTCFSSYSFR